MTARCKGLNWYRPYSKNRFGYGFWLCVYLDDAVSKGVLLVCCGSDGSGVVVTVAEWIAVEF